MMDTPCLNFTAGELVKGCEFRSAAEAVVIEASLNGDGIRYIGISFFIGSDRGRDLYLDLFWQLLGYTLVTVGVPKDVGGNDLLGGGGFLTHGVCSRDSRYHLITQLL